MTGTVLLTGGTGKTASRIANNLQARSIPILLASRKGQEGVPSGFRGVAFDWTNESTYINPFKEDKNIDTIYIIIPPPSPAYDSVKLTNGFIDFAKEKGVRRFVLLSASVIPKGGPTHGQVHAHLDTIGVDYAVVKPSWFFSNFLTTAPIIKAKDEFQSATGTAKVGFVAQEDVADLAAKVLTLPHLGGTEHLIVGPELLSYDDVAEKLSRVLGRKITHRNVSFEERKTFLLDHGLPETIANMLSGLEANVVAKGVEEMIYNNTPDKTIGKISFDEFAQVNKAVWQK